MAKEKRNLLSLTEKEINNIFLISRIPRNDSFKVTKIVAKENSDFQVLKSFMTNIRATINKDYPRKIFLEDGYGSSVDISEKGIFYKFACCKKTSAFSAERIATER